MLGSKAESEGTTGHCVVIDSGSSASIFSKKDLLTDVLPTSKELTLLTNAGNLKSNMMGKHGELMVWHNSSSVANVLGLSHVAKTHRVTMDTGVEKAIYVDAGKKGIMKFEQIKNGLFAHDASKPNLTIKPSFNYHLPSFL